MNTILRRFEIWLLLALAHGKLGHDTDAVTWCERARKHLADRSGRIPWTDRVILQSLLRELD